MRTKISKDGSRTSSLVPSTIALVVDLDPIMQAVLTVAPRTLDTIIIT